MNFKYTIDPNAETPIMLINKHIGIDETDGEGIMGDQFQRELLELDNMGKRRVEVWINSPGGSVMEGFSICSAILNTKCKVDTYCRGLAASISGVIFLCGRTKYMADYGIVMMHDPFGGENVEALDKIKNSLATLIAARCQKTIESIRSIMARESYMDASECIDLGICDEIEVSSDNNKGRLAPVKNDAKAFWKNSINIFNNAVNKLNQTVTKVEDTKRMDFKKINNKLGLMEEASAESTVAAIEALKNKAEISNKKAEDSEKKAAEMEDKLKKMKSEMEDEAKKQKEAYDSLNAEYLKIKNEAEAAAKAAKEKAEAEAKAEAKNMITNAVKDGKIKNEAETIEKWTNKAELDPKGIKDLLDTMGVSAKGPDFSVVKDKAPGSGVIGEVKTAEEIMNYENKLIEERRKAIADKNKK